MVTSSSNTTTILTPEQLNAELQKIKNYKNTTKQLNEKLKPILEQFRNAYVNYHMNPGINEYERIFQSANANMQSLNSQLFSIDNNLEKNIQLLDKNLNQVNTMIQKAKQENSN